MRTSGNFYVVNSSTETKRYYVGVGRFQIKLGTQHIYEGNSLIYVPMQSNFVLNATPLSAAMNLYSN
ncbi:MAG: hypothetical protein LBS01_05110 [Prevotellaceae bacterium]|nr:hypothetical protein [Prevotellaceae bacterium]